MATVYRRTCSFCGNDALKRDSVFIYPASSKKQHLACGKCGKTLQTFLRKNGIMKTMHPKISGSSKPRKLKTKRLR